MSSCLESLSRRHPPNLLPQTLSNPSKWNNSLNVSFDPTTDILSLRGDGDNDYQIITVTLSDLMFNVPGEIVTGITPIWVGNAVYPDTGDSNDALTTTPFFTANSFGVTVQCREYRHDRQ